MRQLAKDRIQTRRYLESFCEQFGVPPCRKKTHRNPAPTSRPHVSRKSKSSPSKYKSAAKKPALRTPNNGKCNRCNKPDHIAKYCKLSKKIKNLNLDDFILNQIEHLLLEDSDNSNDVGDEFEHNFNQIEIDDLESSGLD